MTEALEYLIRLIDDGWEYPDAEWKASVVFHVSCDELREMYDNPSIKGRLVENEY